MMAAGRKKKRLRSGFTTGTAAAAATKAALIYSICGERPHRVDVTLLNGECLTIGVHACRRIDTQTVVCSVFKDAGDDPDVTNGAEIGARVVWKEKGKVLVVNIRGGAGVGVVTKPGLEVLPGEPAINPGPRRMIRRAVSEVSAQWGRTGHLDVEIFVPKGEELARHTMNARLGIIGGISILGTTGVVRPLSHDAYRATIEAALSVARAGGMDRVILTTGRRSERFAQLRWPQIPDEGFVQIGDYFGEAMAMTVERKFKRATLAVFFGKAVKMAQAIPHTHACSARLTLKTLARWAGEITGDADLADQVAGANTARQAFDLLKGDHPDVIEKVGAEVVRSASDFSGRKVEVGAVIFGFDGSIQYDSADGGR